MFFPSDNFLYFIILFTVSIFCGTYLLFTYYRNKLLVVNSLILFLSAFRIAVEYYLPSIPTFEKLKFFIYWQGYGIPVNILIVLQWACIWYYVKPLKGWKWENIAGKIFLWGFLVIPFTFHSWFMATGKIFYYNPEKMANYWKFTMNTDFWYFPIYSYHTKYTLLLVILVLLVGVIRNKKNRIRQFLLFLSYLILPYLYYKYNVPSQWNIPNSGIIYVVHSVIISWYVSNYRLLRSNINLITSDLFNSISDLTISTNSSFVITNFNNNAQKFFNIKFKKIVNFLNYHLIDEHQNVELLMKKLLENRESEIELELKDKNEIKKIMNIKVAPFLNGDEIYGYTFLFTDLTQIRNNEAKLNELNNTKDRLFTIIGHDLRKPALEFRGIQNKVNYLIQKNDFETLNKLGKSLEQSALSLNSLLDNLLIWARTQRGIVSYNPSEIKVVDIVYEVFEFFENVADNKNIKLINNVSDNIYVLSDSNILVTIIRNLVDNSIKFTNPLGEVSISTSSDKNTITIIVKDTGLGMGNYQLQNIFNFKNIEKTKGTFGESGSGLGLNLVKELVISLGGNIKIQSELTEGTTVFCQFPK